MAGTKRLYNWFVEQLNQNSYNVEFSGNYIFKFWNETRGGVSDFEIVRTTEDALDFEIAEVIPVVDVQTLEIPFVEKNDRSDYEKEFYVALRIEDSIDETTNDLVLEFDDTDPKYLALLETIANIKSQLTFTYDGYKHTVKTKEPQKVQTFKNNGKYYTLFGITMNITSLQTGFFGNEMKFWLKEAAQAGYNATDQLDVIEGTIVVAKQSESYNRLANEPVDQTTKINSRNFSVQLTVNYRGDNFAADELLFDELLAENTTTIKKQYELKLEQNSRQEEKIVVITNINAEFRNNSVETITLQLEKI